MTDEKASASELAASETTTELTPVEYVRVLVKKRSALFCLSLVAACDVISLSLPTLLLLGLRVDPLARGRLVRRDEDVELPQTTRLCERTTRKKARLSQSWCRWRKKRGPKLASLALRAVVNADAERTVRVLFDLVLPLVHETNRADNLESKG